MKYTTILFDLDDTLFDFGRAEENAIRKIMRKYGVPETQENILLYVKLNKCKWNALEKAEITRKQLFETRFCEYFDLTGADGDGIAANDDYLSFLVEGSFPLDGAVETCKILSNEYALYIITNGAKKAQHGRLDNSEIIQYFKGVFISEEMGVNKPDIRYFDYVLNHIEEKDKTKILVVGDSLNSDIAGAVKSGLDCCWINKGDHSDNDATFEINRVGDLIEALNT